MGGGVFFFVINMSPRRGFYCIEIRLLVALWRNVFRLLICRPDGAFTVLRSVCLLLCGVMFFVYLYVAPTGLKLN